MSKRSLLHNAVIVNEGNRFNGYIVIDGETIADVGQGSPCEAVVASCDSTEDLNGCLVIPGVIDDQVHFRDPGLTRKGDISTESRAAVAGGVTSYMDMPNVVPQTTSLQALEEKFRLRIRGISDRCRIAQGIARHRGAEIRKEVFRNRNQIPCGAFIRNHHGLVTFLYLHHRSVLLMNTEFRFLVTPGLFRLKIRSEIVRLDCLRRYGDTQTLIGGRFCPFLRNRHGLKNIRGFSRVQRIRQIVILTCPNPFFWHTGDILLRQDQHFTGTGNLHTDITGLCIICDPRYFRYLLRRKNQPSVRVRIKTFLSILHLILLNPDIDISGGNMVPDGNRILIIGIRP